MRTRFIRGVMLSVLAVALPSACGNDSNKKPADAGGTADADGQGSHDGGRHDAASQADAHADERDADVVADAAHRDAASLDGATRDAASADGGGGAVGTPTFVAVGYAGRRARSVDLGVTWTDDVQLGGGGDDEFLLRGVTFAKGVFVAVGWKILTSPDGASNSWTERTNPNGQWMGGVRYGNARFVASGGYGQSIHSRDGLSWQDGGDLQTQASRSLAFGNGIFVSATDPGNWWQSSDGQSWTLMSGGHTDASALAFCAGLGAEQGTPNFRLRPECAEPFTAKGQTYGQGVIVHIDTSGHLERSTDDGKTFQKVLVTGPGFEDVAFGVVP